MKMIAKYTLGVLLLFVAGYSQMTVAAKPVAQPVFPIVSHPYGKSYGVWGQEFVNWLFQYSLFDYPLFQPSEEVDCGKDQSGKVWFLYGALEDGVTRGCTIPKGTSLFISVNSTTSWVPFFGDTEEEIRADAQRDLDGIQTMEAWIDGVPIDPYNYRATSPDGGFVLTINEGTILNELGYPVGVFSPAVVDGYYLMLPPLSVGEHTIGWSSSAVDQTGFFYSYSITWNLHVVP